MMGITEQMKELLRRSFTADTSDDEFVAIPEMGGYYVSKTKQTHDNYEYMFPAEVDGKEVHVYISL